MTNPHPNATVAGSGTGIGVFVVWLLGNVFHLQISAELGAAIAGAVATAALVIGRGGLARLWHRIMHGNQEVKP